MPDNSYRHGTDKPISPSRQRMIEDMTARHFVEINLRFKTSPPTRTAIPQIPIDRAVPVECLS